MRKFECLEQLFDEEICFDRNALLMSLEAYLGRGEILKALDYISRVEDWRHRIDERGNIRDTEEEGEE